MQRTSIAPVFALLFAAGCGGSSTDGQESPLPAPAEADAGSTEQPRSGASAFATIYAKTLSPVCSSCHGGASPVAGLDFSTASNAYLTLVGVRAGGPGSACGASGLVRVDPGASSRSLLYLKVSGAQPCGERMPRGGPPLADDAIHAIAAWIDAGAPSG